MPKYLYKYQSFTAQTLLNVKQQILNFGSPSKFNDPYDCAISPNIRRPTDADVARWLEEYHASREFTDEEIEARQRSTMDEVRQAMWTAASASYETGLSDFIKNRGIACFSEINDDLLMWSHYGGRYRGICLEFDATMEPFSRARPVQYVETFPELNMGQVLFGGASSAIENLYWTKSVSWRYEREWRALHLVEGTKYIYPAEALTGVYFGPDIDFPSIEIVGLILQGQHENVRLYRGKRSTKEFRVTFEQFTYTSYLEAKRKGLSK